MEWGTFHFKSLCWSVGPYTRTMHLHYLSNRLKCSLIWTITLIQQPRSLVELVSNLFLFVFHLLALITRAKVGLWNSIAEY